MKVNSFLQDIWRDPFKVDLRDYKVEISRAQGEKVPSIPNLTGWPYTEGIKRLRQLGIAEENIHQFAGGVPKNEKDILRIRAQKPPAGTPLTEVKQVALQIWERPPKRQ